MSEKEMNSYRFGTGKEPTGEMLSQIMKEVAADASRRSKEVTEAYFKQMCMNIITKKHKWSDRITAILNETN